MASGFLGKMLGRSATSPAVQESLADLQRLATEHPSLAAPAALLSDLLPTILETPAHPARPALPAERAAEKLDGGVPLLRGEGVSLDGKDLRRRWGEICSALRRHPSSDAAAALAAAVRDKRLSMEDLAAAVVDGRAAEVSSRADALDLDAGLAATILRFTLFPHLVALQEALAPWQTSAPWNRGYCPTCGCWPLLGEFRGLEQFRWLRCGLCAAAWQFPRMACPFCDNRNHEQLGYLLIESQQDQRRVATCQGCRGYVKMLTTLSSLSPAQLLVADVATILLDLAAAQCGYAVA